MDCRHSGPGCAGQQGLSETEFQQDLRGGRHACQQDQGIPAVTPQLQQAHDEKAVQDSG